MRLPCPWGTYHYQPGLQRYRCKEQGCKRTFNDLTGTLLDGSKRSLMHWILATFLLCLSCSSRRITKELGVHVRTGYGWCWWLRNTALSYEIGRQLDGTVEADDLYHTAGHKGQGKQGGTKALGRKPRRRRKKREPGRGHYDKDRPAIIAWVSRQGAVVLQATRDFTLQTVQKAADLAVQTGSRLYTDSASSYRALKGYVHDYEALEEFSQTYMIFGAMLGSCCCVPPGRRYTSAVPREGDCYSTKEAHRLSKNTVGSGLGRLESAECGGDIEHKVERPTQQLSQGPDGPREAKGVKSPHPERSAVGDHFLVVAVGPLTGSACGIETLPSR